MEFDHTILNIMKPISYSGKDFYYTTEIIVSSGFFTKVTYIYTKCKIPYYGRKYLFFGKKILKWKNTYELLYISNIDFESHFNSKEDIRREMEKMWPHYIEFLKREVRDTEIHNGDLI